MSVNPSRVLLLGRHELGVALCKKLVERGSDIAILPAAHEDQRRQCVARFQNPGITRFQAGDDVAECAQIFKPTVVISAGFDRILSKSVLERLPNALNIHFGALPRYRGCFSIPHAIMNNDSQIGVTLHHMWPGIDDGPILYQRMVPVTGLASAWSIYLDAVELGATLFAAYLDQIEAGNPVAEMQQDEEHATYFSPVFPGGYEINWRQTVGTVRNYIRACHFPPYAGATSLLNGKSVEFSWPLDWTTGRPPQLPGTIVTTSGGGIGIATLNGTVLPGRIAVDGQSFDFAQAVLTFGWMGQKFNNLKKNVTDNAKA